MSSIFFHIAEVLPFILFLFLIIFAIINRYTQNKNPKTTFAKKLKKINKYLDIFILAFFLFAFIYGMFIMFDNLG